LDGNDIGGCYIQVPIGTYIGWNLFRDDWFANGFCPLSGSIIPFAATKHEREWTGDPRPSQFGDASSLRWLTLGLVTR
jgi:hypothetical protein